MTGDAHGSKEMSWSSAHSNVAPAWLAWNAKVALVLSVMNSGIAG